MSEVLPEGWASCQLRDLSVHALGGDWGRSANNRQADSHEVGVIRGTEFRHWREQRASGAARRFLRSSSLEKRRLEADDLVVEISGGGPNQPVGRVLRVDAEALRLIDVPLVCSNFCRQLRLSPRVSATYFEHALNHAYNSGRLDAIQTQTTNLRNLNFGGLLDLQMPIAPLNEQRRIVAKIEAALEQVRRTKARLNRVRLTLDRFRQAVLASACSGRLTEGWRNLAQETGEATSERLRVLEEKRFELWQQRAAERGSRRSRYPEPFASVAPEDVEIPSGWTWVTASSLAILDVGFAFKSSGFQEAGVRLLRGQNIAPGALRWDETKCWPSSDIEQHKHLLVEPGEIILGMDRPLVSAGLKIARATQEDLPALLVQRVMRFKMADPSDTDYLYVCLSERRFIDFLAHDGMTGSDLPHITGTGVAEFPVPLPPRDEQVEIVRRVGSLLAYADAAEKRVGQVEAHIGSLPQAILSKAFSGELVPTEADIARAEGRDYETAEQLLQRVRAQAVESSAKGKKATSATRRKARGRKAAR